MKIEPGILVEVISSARTPSHVGKIYTVIGPADPDWLAYWGVEKGWIVDTKSLVNMDCQAWFSERCLRPIRPDNKTNGLSYSDVIEGINSIGVPATPVKADVNHD